MRARMWPLTSVCPTYDNVHRLDALSLDKEFRVCYQPQIPTEGAEARIADVGAGTGSAFRSTLVRLEL